MMHAPHSIRRTISTLSSVLALALCGGCASYHLGSPAEPEFESLYVRPAQNESFAPQAQALVSTQLRQALIRDGRIAIVSDPAQADAILEVTLTDYSRSAAARQSTDTVTAQNFDLRLDAQLSLYNQNSGNYYFQGRQLSERSSAYVENPYADPSALNTDSYIQSEYNAMPRLARGLARKIADEVLSPWPSAAAVSAEPAIEAPTGE